MPNLRAIGRAAEDRAAEYLREQGFTIVTRRYKAHRGEIDVVALEGDELVMVEVKATLAPGLTPEAAMGEHKRAALVRAAQQYVGEVAEAPDRPIRFDLIAIDRDGLRHYRDVFGA